MHAVAAAGPLPPGAERLQVKTPDGEVLHGVFFPGPAQTDAPKTLVLGFGGNAWNGQDVGSYLHELYPDVDVVAFHYRGYWPSTGKPSAEALLADAPLVYDATIAKVRPERTIAVGFSIGSGVAASLANRRRVDGLILITPFDSLKAVASSLYPWFPVGPFFKHEINSVEGLRGSAVPVAIVAGERDEIIPAERTSALRNGVPNLVFDRTITRAGHNDIYTRSEFQAAMDEAFEAVLHR
ncbi:MAG: alpha/beta hydrolase [Sphingomonas sp.]|nr:alpha/beta hydrolase [Sphingomonas sp.]